MNGYVDLGQNRYYLNDGVFRIEIVEEYGFVAATCQVEFDAKMLNDAMPPEVRELPGVRIPVMAYITDLADGRPKQFNGYLDDLGGTLDVFPEPQATIVLAARSFLSLLTDESDDNPPITNQYYDKKWSYVVADIVKKRGFGTNYIEGSTEWAGEQLADGSWFLSIDNELAGEIINNAVSATGFIANTTNNKEFIFARSIVDANYVPITFTYLERDESSEIFTANYNNGAFEFFQTNNKFAIINPGSQVRILIPNNGLLSGMYYVTRVQYSALSDGVSNIQYTVATELPVLKEAEEAT